MSADWFCKIGEKKVGPLNGQQLKTIVSKGQLKPEHLVRRGDEGPWVPAGRIKGLFPAGTGAADGQAKKAPPKAKTSALPTAEQAPSPPSEVPQDLALGGHHKHVEMDVDKFNIETTPVMVSRKKMKGGLQGLKKKEQQKAKVILFSVIGGGLAFVLIVVVWALATNKFGSSGDDKKATEVAGLDTPVNTGAAKPEPEKKPEPKPQGPIWPVNFKSVSVENTMIGSVDVKALKPVRGPKPESIKSDESEVLIVPVNLQLKAGAKTNVEFKGWGDEHFKKDVKLTDDKAEGKGNSYTFLGQYVRVGGDAKEVSNKFLQIGLVFELPGKMPKTMYLALPSGALHGDDVPMIGYKIDTNVIVSEAKSASSSSGAAAEKKDDAK